MTRPAPGLQRIVRTAARLFARDGYDSVSVADVARVAGVSKATVFHHFPSKLHLYRTIFSAAATQQRERVTRELDFSLGVHDGLRRFIQARTQTHRRSSDAARLVMREMTEGKRRLKNALRSADVAASYRLVEQALGDAQRGGVIRADVDCSTGAQLLMIASGPLFQLYRQLGQRGESSRAEIDRFAGTLADLLAAGLNPEEKSNRQRAAQSRSK